MTRQKCGEGVLGSGWNIPPIFKTESRLEPKLDPTIAKNQRSPRFWGKKSVPTSLSLLLLALLLFSLQLFFFRGYPFMLVCFLLLWFSYTFDVVVTVVKATNDSVLLVHSLSVTHHFFSFQPSVRPQAIAAERINKNRRRSERSIPIGAEIRRYSRPVGQQQLDAGSWRQ